MDWKKIGKKLLFPPIWLMVILVIISAVTLSLVFVKGIEQSIPAYIVYVLAFYTLSTSSRLQFQFFLFLNINHFY